MTLFLGKMPLKLTQHGPEVGSGPALVCCSLSSFLQLCGSSRPGRAGAQGAGLGPRACGQDEGEMEGREGKFWVFGAIAGGVRDGGIG